MNELAQKVEDYIGRGSGHVISFVAGLDVTLSCYNPLDLGGSSYLPLPLKVAKTKAVINMKNKDDKCFMWSVTRALNMVDVHPERNTPLLRKQAEELNWSSIKFPLEPNKQSIDKFEEANNVSVCIFGYEEDKYVPVRLPKRECERDVNLFYFGDGSGKMHYAVVNGLSRLLGSSLSKHESKSYICRRCLCNQHTAERLEEHVRFGSKHEPARTVMPPKGSVLKFRARRKTIRHPVVVYYDFECSHERKEEMHGQTCLKDEHIPVAFGMVVVSDIPGFRPESVRYRGPDAQKVFVKELESFRDKFYHKFRIPEKMIFGEKEQKLHDSQDECYGCGEKFYVGHPRGHKVRDHCFLTGCYRGALHNVCNLKMKQCWTIPVLAHNSSKYDSHLFVRDLCGDEGEPTDVGAIPENEQHYISFFKDKYFKEPKGDGSTFVPKVTLNFVDTYRHLQCGLEGLVRGLPERENIFMRRYFGEENAKLLNRKGIYPYEYLDSLERFEETSLPPREKFDSYLGNGNVYEEGDEKGKIEPDKVSEEDYAYAQRVWEELGCQNFGEYTETYCMADTLQLADVFEAYRRETMETFGIDPVCYPTLSSVAQDAMLKLTGAEVELLTDENMYLFFEEGVRGWVSMACKRYSKANNKYLGDRYDPNKEEVHILYHDANALYGGCLMQPLPYKNFRWMGKGELNRMEKDHSLIKSCTLEVDLDVPKDQTFHDYTNCFPLAPEHKVINGVTKLTPNLLDKRRCIVHHSTLQTYLKCGLVLRKIHRGVSYTEKEFIRPYIELCTKKRQASKTDFESSLWKLYGNAVFGKQMESVHARSGVVIVSGETEKGKKRLRKLVASPTFKGAIIFANSSLTSVNRAKPEVKLDKPIQVGQVVLDMSKSVMFGHWYGVVKPLWENKVRLVGMDTDSLMMEVRGSNPYVDMTPLVSKHFDTSKFEGPHPSGIPIGLNKKVPLLFKDEMGGKTIY